MSRREGPPFPKKPVVQEQIEGKFKVVEKEALTPDAESESVSIDQLDVALLSAEAARMREKSEEVYFALSKEIKEAGLETKDIPAWSKAYATYVRMIGIANNLGRIKTQEKLDAQTDLFDELSDTFATKISEKVGEEITRVLAERAPIKQEAGEASQAAPTEGVSENQEDKPIVMLNTILSKQAGLKPKKHYKAHKSVSEGGTVYKGKVFESIDGEPAAKSHTEAEHVEKPIIARTAPETHAEYKTELRRSIEEINKDIVLKRDAIRELEESGTHNFKETERFQARNGGTPITVEQAILRTEEELRALEKEKNATNTVSESASSAEPEKIYASERSSEVASVVENPSETTESNISDLLAERETRMQSKAHKKKKRGFWRGAFAALGLFVATAPDELAPGTHVSSPPAASRAFAAHEKVATPSTFVSIEQNGESADVLFGKLQKELNGMYRDPKNIPDVVTKKIIETDPHDLAVALHFMRGKESASMHSRDSLEVNALGQLVFHDSTKGFDHPQILMESTIAGAKVRSTYDKWPHEVMVHKQQEAHAALQQNAPHAETIHETNPEILAQYAKEKAEHGFKVGTDTPENFAKLREELRTTKEAHAPVVVPHFENKAPAETHVAPEATVPTRLNAHGFDLSKPEVGMVKGNYFAHASNPDDSYMAAGLYAKEHPNAPVYYVDQEKAKDGSIRNIVRGLIFEPGKDTGALPINSFGVQIPEVPADADYQPLSAK